MFCGCFFLSSGDFDFFFSFFQAVGVYSCGVDIGFIVFFDGLCSGLDGFA